MTRKDSVVGTAIWVVRGAVWATRAFLAALCVALVFTWFSPLIGAALLAQDTTADLAAATTGARLLLLIGIAMGLAAAGIFRELSAMLATTQAGDPFVPRNVARLQTIGWWLLGLQLLEFPAAAVRTHFPALGSAAPSGDISIVGWLAVLMVFVLSRVFGYGSALRDDLAGTV